MVFLQEFILILLYVGHAVFVYAIYFFFANGHCHLDANRYDMINSSVIGESMMTVGIAARRHRHTLIEDNCKSMRVSPTQVHAMYTLQNHQSWDLRAGTKDDIDDIGHSSS